jgi:hypothetical protein
MFRRTLAAAALLCAVPAAPAHAGDYVWRAAGHLSEPMTGTASAVLGDGRVLVAGGRPTGSREDAATVDLFDPRSGTWAEGPPMAHPREHATAVTMRDGKVLVVGGLADADRRVAELFDPAAGTWKTVASSTAFRAASPGFALDDGRALFIGGSSYSSSDGPGEIYDPRADTWSRIASPHGLSVAGAAVTRLRDGRFLVLGTTSTSTGTGWVTTPAAELYDASSDTWTPVAAPRVVGEGSGAALLPDGRVLVAGGRPSHRPGAPAEATAHRAAEIFDPATGTWSPTGELNHRRADGSTLTALADGSVVAVGGAWSSIGYLAIFDRYVVSGSYFEATAEVYDVASGTWRQTPAIPHARAGHFAQPLADGSLLVAAGVSGPEGAATAAVDRLVPQPPAPAAPVLPPVVTPKPVEVKPGTVRFLKAPKRLKPSRTGTLAIKVRCGGAACSDRLVLRGRGRVLGQRDFKAAAGKTVAVRVKLGAAARRALRDRTTTVTATLRRQGTRTTLRIRG